MSSKVNFIFENQGTTSFLVYNFNPGDIIDTLSSGMMLNNRIIGLIPYTFSQIDEKKYFKYNITSKVTLKNFFAGTVNKKRLFGAMLGIANAIIEAEEYMIEIDKLIFDMDYIFVDVSSNTASLVCLPLSNRKVEYISIGDFIKNIMYSVQFDPTENCDYVAKIITFLNNSATFSIADFKRVMDGILISDSKNRQDLAKPSPAMPKQQEANTEQKANISQPAAPKQPTQITKDKQQGHESQTRKNSVTPQSPITEILEPQKQKPQPPKISMGFEVPSSSDSNKSEEKKNSFFSSLFGGKKKEEKGNEGIEVLEKTDKGMRAGTSANTSNPVPTSSGTEQVIPQPPFIVENEDLGFLDKTTVIGSSNSQGLNNIGSSSAGYTYPYITRKRTSERIFINKPVFRIGNQRDFVDYLCSDNKAVSRSHADILSKNGEYFIRDNNSTNGTYVNGIRISSNQEVKIKHEDNIAIADEAFQFRIY